MALPRLPLNNYAFTSREFWPNDSDPEKWDLDAPYQRGHVWTKEQQRNLIKSLLMGLPIGTVFVNVAPRHLATPVYGRIVDGKQRITAIRAFVAGQLTVPADWFDQVDVDDSSNGQVWWTALSRRARNIFGATVVGVAESHLSTIEEEAELYLLINFGGVAQTDADKARAASIARKEHV